MPKILAAVSCDDSSLKSVVQSVVQSFPDIEIIAEDPPLIPKQIEQYDLIVYLIKDNSENEAAKFKSLAQSNPNTSWIVISPHSPDLKTRIDAFVNSGNIEVVWQPNLPNDEAQERYYRSNFIRSLTYLRTQRNLRSIQPVKAPPDSNQETPNPETFKLIAIACSTGGPDALKCIIPELPADLGLPILIVQHMPPEFTHRFAENLNQASPLTVVEAMDGQFVEADTVYIAPGGLHMEVKKLHHGHERQIPLRIVSRSTPPVNNCRPSADVLFASLAKEFSGKILLAILTGMGADGCAGARELKKLGAYCLTQSEGTCVVYGMPKAVADAGLSDETAPLPLISQRIASLVKRAANRQRFKQQ